MEPQNACGQDAGHFGATLVRRQKRGSSIGRMGRLLVELPTTTFAWRPARCLADSLVNSLYLLTYPVGGRYDALKLNLLDVNRGQWHDNREQIFDTFRYWCRVHDIVR